MGIITKITPIDITSPDERKRNWSIQKVEKLKEKYKIRQLPFIKIVDDDNNVLDSWTGFRPSKINEWYGKNQKGSEKLYYALFTRTNWNS